MELPFDRTWWIVPDRVAGGRFPGTPDSRETTAALRALVDVGVTLVINLTEPGEIGRDDRPFPDYRGELQTLADEARRRVRVLWVPVADNGVPTRTQVLDIIAAIEGESYTFIHCWGGHGRTGTVAGCLHREAGLSSDEVFSSIASARERDAYLRSQPSPQTREQRKFVKAWPPRSLQRRDRHATGALIVVRTAASKDVRPDWMRSPQPSHELGERLNTPPSSVGRSLSRAERIEGCLLGGALGDALGAPVEFMWLPEIRKAFPNGVQPGESFCITDDTQMTLFTVEGLLRARERGTDPVHEVRRAYSRWLSTQGEDVKVDVEAGWLVRESMMHARRAPGVTCLSALRSGLMGSISKPLNDSKGCGGVMRVAPAAMLSDDPFRLACDLAAITHGHPSGYCSAGVMATLLSGLLSGMSFAAAIAGAIGELRRRRPDADETAAALNHALARATVDNPTPEALERIGAGWIAEEALAAAVWCVLVESDPVKCLQLAVTHSGDSDSTGALVGQIVGAMHGTGVFPREWIESIEEIDVLRRMLAEIELG